MSITFDMMSTTDLLETNKTLLAARHLFGLQATRFRHAGALGGETVRGWAAAELARLDEQIFLVVMEMDSRDLSEDEDAKLERDIAIRESYDVLPIELPWTIEIVRRASA